MQLLRGSGYVAITASTYMTRNRCEKMNTEDVLDRYKCYLCAEILQDALSATEHLKKIHSKKDGDSLQCMRLREDGLFCNVELTRHRTLRKHMRENKCRLYSSDVKQIIDPQPELEGWACMLDEFGALKVESCEKENERHSLAALTESFVDRLITSNVSHDIVMR